MKKFVSPLDRVAAFRRSQARMEEAKLEALYAQLRALEAREVVLLEERAASETELLSAPATTGEDWSALDTFRRFMDAERVRLERQRAECRQRISTQMPVVTAKRRDLRLLDRLKEQRLKDWKAELGSEVDAQADEAYLAKWNRGG